MPELSNCSAPWVISPGLKHSFFPRLQKTLGAKLLSDAHMKLYSIIFAIQRVNEGWGSLPATHLPQPASSLLQLHLHSPQDNIVLCNYSQQEGCKSAKYLSVQPSFISHRGCGNLRISRWIHRATITHQLL